MRRHSQPSPEHPSPTHPPITHLPPTHPPAQDVAGQMAPTPTNRPPTTRHHIRDPHHPTHSMHPTRLQAHPSTHPPAHDVAVHLNVLHVASSPPKLPPATPCSTPRPHPITPSPLHAPNPHPSRHTEHGVIGEPCNQHALWWSGWVVLVRASWVAAWAAHHPHDPSTHACNAAIHAPVRIGFSR